MDSELFTDLFDKHLNKQLSSTEGGFLKKPLISTLARAKILFDASGFWTLVDKVGQVVQDLATVTYIARSEQDWHCFGPSDRMRLFIIFHSS